MTPHLFKLPVRSTTISQLCDDQYFQVRHRNQVSPSLLEIRMTLEHTLIGTWHWPLLGIVDDLESIGQDIRVHHDGDEERGHLHFLAACQLGFFLSP